MTDKRLSPRELNDKLGIVRRTCANCKITFHCFKKMRLNVCGLCNAGGYNKALEYMKRKPRKKRRYYT